MKVFALAFLLLLPMLSNAQVLGMNDFILDVRRPLATRFSSIDELYNPRPINNAFTLKLKTETRSRNVSAHVIFTGTPGTQPPDKWICLKMINTTSNNAITSENAIALTASPALLFTQPGTTYGNKKYNDFHYSVIFNPISTFIKTGTYNYSIIFTMTEQ